MIPLYKPYMKANLDLSQILSNDQLAYGKNARLFENKMAGYLGHPLFLSTNNFSSSVMLAIATLGLNPGDKVVISPLVCLAISQPIALLGIELVFCDINENTGSIDGQRLEEIITSGSISCIILTHFAGIVADIDDIKRISKKYSIPVIEDASDAFGSTYKGNLVGTHGFDITVFSFSAVRNPNLIDAGGITFSNKKLFEKATLIRDAGIDRRKFRDELGEIDLSYDIVLPGLGATLDEVRSYIGIKNLVDLEKIISSNKSMMKRIISILRNIENIDFFTSDIKDSNGWILPIKTKYKQETLKLLKHKGINASSVHGNIAFYSVYSSHAKVPNAKKFINEFLAIPCGWWIHDIDDYLTQLVEVFSNVNGKIKKT